MDTFSSITGQFRHINWQTHFLGHFVRQSTIYIATPLLYLYHESVCFVQWAWPFWLVVHCACCYLGASTVDKPLSHGFCVSVSYPPNSHIIIVRNFGLCAITPKVFHFYAHTRCNRKTHDSFSEEWCCCDKQSCSIKYRISTNKYGFSHDDAWTQKAYILWVVTC